MGFSLPNVGALALRSRRFVLDVELCGCAQLDARLGTRLAEKRGTTHLKQRTCQWSRSSSEAQSLPATKPTPQQITPLATTRRVHLVITNEGFCRESRNIVPLPTIVASIEPISPLGGKAAHWALIAPVIAPKNPTMKGANSQPGAPTQPTVPPTIKPIIQIDRKSMKFLRVRLQPERINRPRNSTITKTVSNKDMFIVHSTKVRSPSGWQAC